MESSALSMDPFGDYKACLHGQSEMDKLWIPSRNADVCFLVPEKAHF